MAAKFFSKLGQGANRFFGKIRQDAPGIMSKISKGIGQAGSFLGNGLGQISKITNSPIAQTIAGGLGLAPELGMLNAGLGAARGGLSKGSTVLQSITDPSSYKSAGSMMDTLQRVIPQSNMMRSPVQPQFL